MTNISGGPRLRGGWLVGLMLGLPGLASAQLAPDWTVSLPTLSAPALAVDGGNNSLLLGSLPGAPMQLTKVSALGVQRWQRSLGSAGAISRASAVATDAAGNAFVAGAALDSAGFPQGPVVMKLDPNGNLLWQDLSPSFAGSAQQLVTDATGNAHVLVALRNAATGQQEISLLKYSPAGQRLWSRPVGAAYVERDALVLTAAGQVVVAGGGGAAGQAVVTAFDALGNVLMTAPLGLPGAASLAAGRGGELYAIGGDASGLWVQKFGAGLAAAWRAPFAARWLGGRAVVDSAGNLVVSGAVDSNTGLLQVVIPNWLTLKISPAGALLWTHGHGVPGRTSVAPAALALGSDDAVYLSGEGAEPVVDALGSVSYRRTMLTVKLAASGGVAWTNFAASAPRGLAVKPATDGGLLVLADAGLLAPPPAALVHLAQSGLPNVAPTAVASATPSAGPAPLAVQFSSTGSADADSGIAQYAWDFGDGQTSSAANPAHVYATGSYTARLTVTDNRGAATQAAPVVVTANPVLLAPATPKTLGLASSSVLAGSSTLATLTVSTAAGVTVRLSSSNTAAASVPASVVIPAGALSATFPVTALLVRKDTRVTIQASANGATVSTALTVRKR